MSPSRNRLSSSIASAGIAAAGTVKFQNVIAVVNNVIVVRSGLRGHERIDRRSIALHCAIAEKLRANPALLEIAHENLARWSPQAGRSGHYLDAWREILARPLDEILTLMVQDTERMRAMRQNNPFAGVLDARERWAIYDRFPLEPV
jgi:hypothetical protein